jgi:predicted O-linked N-acetylglucosamine transferase (SPINDLY family)
MSEPGVAAALGRRFAERGVDPARIQFSGASPHRAMLAEYGDVDVALDPFPFTGGVTTCEALWMGVPVVTLEGQSVIERQSACLLRAVGADALIARDREEYKRVALAAASEPAGDAGERRRYREAMLRSPLTDADDMARKLEAAYRQAIL